LKYQQAAPLKPRSATTAAHTSDSSDDHPPSEKGSFKLQVKPTFFLSAVTTQKCYMQSKRRRAHQNHSPCCKTLRDCWRMQSNGNFKRTGSIYVRGPGERKVSWKISLAIRLRRRRAL